MDFLGIKDKWFLISGVANKKSVAYFSAKTLIEAGAHCLFSVQKEEQIPTVNKLFPNSPVIIVDVENKDHITSLKEEVLKHTDKLHGFLHSLAFANFSEGLRPFHETKREDFLQAAQISSFSFVEMSNALKSIFDHEASLVTISISNTKATSYGYLGPI
ncbi:MAG TPA: SDR family oxidoreductase, partial [Bacteriovoracaceae bacterium]|nr:SDR family oxidoreductase [Bacteriovoracaceae bacterium]